MTVGRIETADGIAERHVARRHLAEPLEQPPMVRAQPRGHRIGHRLEAVQQRRDNRIGQRSRGSRERPVVARQIVNVPSDQADQPPVILDRECHAHHGLAWRVGHGQNRFPAGQIVAAAPEETRGVAESHLDVDLLRHRQAEIRQPAIRPARAARAIDNQVRRDLLARCEQDTRHRIRGAH
jgi:hypothetical protein